MLLALLVGCGVTTSEPGVESAFPMDWEACAAGGYEGGAEIGRVTFTNHEASAVDVVFVDGDDDGRAFWITSTPETFTVMEHGEPEVLIGFRFNCADRTPEPGTTSGTAVFAVDDGEVAIDWTLTLE